MSLNLQYYQQNFYLKSSSDHTLSINFHILCPNGVTLRILAMETFFKRRKCQKHFHNLHNISSLKLNVLFHTNMKNIFKENI